jgi:hypothetical protein
MLELKNPRNRYWLAGTVLALVSSTVTHITPAEASRPLDAGFGLLNASVTLSGAGVSQPVIPLAPVLGGLILFSAKAESTE